MLLVIFATNILQSLLLIKELVYLVLSLGLKGDFDWAFSDNLTKFQLLETFTLRFLVNLHFSHC